MTAINEESQNMKTVADRCGIRFLTDHASEIGTKAPQDTKRHGKSDDWYVNRQVSVLTVSPTNASQIRYIFIN